MNRPLAFSLAASLLTLVLATDNCSAQVTASSYSTGGTAVSKASGRGNTRLSASAIASNGGFARATMHGSGRNGGYATGSSNATAIGGTAISRGQSHANGWGARSHANSSARSYFGNAVSDSRAVAHGNWSNARSSSGARAYWGQNAYSGAEAIDRRSGPAPITTYPVPNQWNRGPVQQNGANSGYTRPIRTYRNW